MVDLGRWTDEEIMNRIKMLENNIKAMRNEDKIIRHEMGTNSNLSISKNQIGQVQAKVKDTTSQEAFYKLSSLIDFYNKPAQNFKEVNIILKII